RRGADRGTDPETTRLTAEEAAYVGDVAMHLRDQFAGPVEGHLTTYARGENCLHRLAVQVEVVAVQDVRLHPTIRAVECGIRAHADRCGHSVATVDTKPPGVDAVGRDGEVVGRGHIRGGKAHLAAAFVTL